MNEKLELVDRVDFIKKSCEGKKVLHLGCTNYPYTEDSINKNMLLHFELDKMADELYGFDFDQKGLDLLAEKGFDKLYQADLEKLEKVSLDETFDVIIAGEIIEHLSNPGLFLKGIQRFMNNRTNLIITTVNSYCALRFVIYGLKGKQGINEPVHPDHVAYYSYKTLSLIIKRAGLDLKKFYFYDLGKEHREFNRKLFNFINDVSVKISPQLSDGVIAVCGLSKSNI